MADYYTQFCATLTYETTTQRKWLEQALRDLDDVPEEERDEVCAQPWRDEDDPEVGVAFSYDFGTDGAVTFLRLYSDENGDAYRAAELVHAFMKNFNIDSIWLAEWAGTCSKMREDGFGGGGVVATKDGVRVMSGGSWTREMCDYFEKHKKLPPTDDALRDRIALFEKFIKKNKVRAQQFKAFAKKNA